MFVYLCTRMSTKRWSFFYPFTENKSCRIMQNVSKTYLCCNDLEVVHANRELQIF